ncbi:hypothetical protein AMEX_G19301 [Astyanax mexicanus]|uniref:Uncharacterized protein n=1 Tax=Astyanax mexicanus TaxID=7994 RepID=A0A8T2LBG7_ASTMX|nr:hypothetical protein AMEX_G19301 [Astyanax mexicanus]
MFHHQSCVVLYFLEVFSSSLRRFCLGFEEHLGKHLLLRGSLYEPVTSFTLAVSVEDIFIILKLLITH